jgi:hypothetical protein
MLKRWVSIALFVVPLAAVAALASVTFVAPSAAALTGPSTHPSIRTGELSSSCPAPSLLVQQTNTLIEQGQSDKFGAFLVTWRPGGGFWHRCYSTNTPVVATWRNSGGTLTVTAGGTQAVFSAASVGTFTITVRYQSFVQSPTVMVQIANEELISDMGCAQSKTCVTYPAGGLLAEANGVLYGTGAFGGPNGGGAAFELVPRGAGYAIRDIFNFNSSTGFMALGGLIADASGSFFGAALVGGLTTCPLIGGFYGCGTVFELTPLGQGYALTVLYKFRGGNDGYSPSGRLVMDRNGDLFGTTLNGGSTSLCNGGCGTVFELARTGSRYEEYVLHHFQGSDGSYPVSGVIVDAAGNLYGATVSGGGTPCTVLGPGCGLVFELVRGKAGYTYRILYRFQAKADGGLPISGLVADGSGALYGTTWGFGAAGGGTAFKLAPNGTTYRLTTLHAFGDAGFIPLTMTDVHGTFYGMTEGGGVTGSGVVFSLTPPIQPGANYTYRVLHTFEGTPLDGDNHPDAGQFFGWLWPASPLIFQNGMIYGTTYSGGSGGGTVFKLVP